MDRVEVEQEVVMGKVRRLWWSVVLAVGLLVVAPGVALAQQQSPGPSGQIRRSLDQLGDAGTNVWNAVGGIWSAVSAGGYGWVLGIAVGVLIWRVFLRPLFSR